MIATGPTASNAFAKAGPGKNADPVKSLLDVVKKITLSRPRVPAATGKTDVHSVQQRTRQRVCPPWAAT